MLGRDITYCSRRTLPLGADYDCQLPGWRGKEYHVVVRSGLVGLGAWHDEQRNLYEDYLAYMGELPGRKVRVSLIAKNVFQRRKERCSSGR